MSLNVYTFFHLNLAFSSLDEDKRAQVVERCYWPILRLAERHGIPVGVEAPSWTLAEIGRLDPSWLGKFRTLIEDGKCEAIAAGYVQMIGPVVPPDVTRWNLQLGLEDYDALLGVRPRLALVNEQCYSAGIVPLYAAAGFDGLIAEWESAFSANPTWNLNWRYFPQRARGVDEGNMPVVWNRSIAFQKFQRYAHGDLDLMDVVSYVLEQKGDTDRAFPIYGSDAEVFDFRPNRYHTEAGLLDGEWDRIETLFKTVAQSPDVTFVLPSEVLAMTVGKEADNILRLETPEHPTPTKKQEKYNVARWSVTGRSDLPLNTRCWRLFKALRERKGGDADAALWRRLCYVWSSDFRTHITDRRWAALKDDLAALEWDLGIVPPTPIAPIDVPNVACAPMKDRVLTCGTADLSARFNCRKGLSLESFIDRRLGENPLIGTLPHGHFDSMHMAADFFTGHTVFELPGSPKVTDLQTVDPSYTVNGAVHRIGAVMETGLGRLEKTWRLDTDARTLELDYRIMGITAKYGSLRLGYITLIAESFNGDDLCVWSHNGGTDLEAFELRGRLVNHGRAVSSLVSANAGIGATEGVVVIGDRERCVRISFDKTSAALIALIHHEDVHGKMFARVCFSAREVDDTSRNAELLEPDLSVRFRISALPTEAALVS